MTKNRTPTPVYLDPGMHPGLEVKGLNTASLICTRVQVNQRYLDIKGSLTQCWRNVGPPSASSPQQTLSVSFLLRSMPGHSLHHPRGTVTRRGHNVGLMLARRLRRRPTINPTLCSSLVSPVMHGATPTNKRHSSDFNIDVGQPS